MNAQLFPREPRRMKPPAKDVQLELLATPADRIIELAAAHQAAGGRVKNYRASNLIDAQTSVAIHANDAVEVGTDEIIGLGSFTKRKALHVSRTADSPPRVLRPEASAESSCFLIRFKRSPNLPSVDTPFQCTSLVGSAFNSSLTHTPCQAHAAALAPSRSTEGIA